MSLNADDLLEDVATHMKAVLERHSISGAIATSAAAEVAELVRDHWGGQSIYVPFGLALKTRHRDLKIYADFTGENYKELARKHGVSEMRIRQIVSAVRKQTRERSDSKKEAQRLARANREE